MGLDYTLVLFVPHRNVKSRENVKRLCVIIIFRCPSALAVIIQIHKKKLNAIHSIHNSRESEIIIFASILRSPLH